MNSMDRESWRYSVCIASEHVGKDDRPEVHFNRVADYVPEEGSELIPALTFRDLGQSDDLSRCENPTWVYCQEAFDSYFQRDSDFYLIKWRPDSYNLTKQIAFVCSGNNDSPYVSDDIREVITISGVTDKNSLIAALDKGIVFPGKTTKEFYLAYERRGNMRYAIKCERKDFVSDGQIRLSKALSNVRTTVLSAPIISLNEQQIVECPHYGSRSREISLVLGSITSGSERLLLRPLSYFASDYVKYYLSNANTSSKITKEDRKRIAALIDEALSKPALMGDYLGVECPEDEIASLRSAIASQMHGRPDEDLELVRRSLLDDEQFRNECIEVVRGESDVILRQAKKELAQRQRETNEARQEENRIKDRIGSLNDELVELEKRISAGNAELENLEAMNETAQQEIENNVALRLGLRSVARECGAAASSDSRANGIVCDVAETIPHDATDNPLVEVIEKNLKEARVSSFADDLEKELRRVSVGIACCIRLGVPMAIPEPLAEPVSRVLASTLGFDAPTRIIVPPDCRDIHAVLDCVAKPGVYMLESVIDSANEGVLFSLLRSGLPSVFVFSFRSYASALLLAREVWDSLFFLPVGSLMKAPSSGIPSRLLSSEGVGIGVPIRNREVREVAKEIRFDVPGLRLPGSSFVLPASISLIAEDLDQDCDVESIVSQHLLLASGLTKDAADALIQWQAGGEDAGFRELLMRSDSFNG